MTAERISSLMAPGVSAWQGQRAEGEVIHVGKNTKVSVLSQRLIERFLEQGWIELEAVGAEAVNQAVKAVAKARQTLEAEGYSLVIIPKLVEVPLGHGSQTVVHLTVVNMGESFFGG